MAILTSRLSRRLPVLLALVASVWWARLPVAAQETLENDVKAAFLFNFTKFVDWPPGAFEGPGDALRVCVLADGTFTASVDRIIVDETVRGRPLRRMVPGIADLPRCHVLYIGLTELDGAEKMLRALGNAPVLTVGETPRFTSQLGGAISFVLVNDRVRFDVNLPGAERAGLTISSKLLRVARNVQRDGGRP